MTKWWVILWLLLWSCEGASAKVIEWSGYHWQVKANDRAMGPGPNLWSDSSRSVWVDRDGRLHLKIRKVRGRWHCAEVICTQPLGYGRYLFFFSSRLDNLDKQVVAGAFVYGANTSEIDIEFSKWGQGGRVGFYQYAVHLGVRQDGLFRRPYATRAKRSIHGFHWTPRQILFESHLGHQGRSQSFQKWAYPSTDVPVPGDERVHINLWLFQGQEPSRGRETHIIVDRFVFIPLPGGP